MVAISYRHCITYLKVAKKINFKSSDQEKKKIGSFLEHIAKIPT